MYGMLSITVKLGADNDSVLNLVITSRHDKILKICEQYSQMGGLVEEPARIKQSKHNKVQTVKTWILK